MKQDGERTPLYSVLLVDDDPHTHYFLRNYLQNRNYAVLGARNGEEALEIYQNHHPDIVLADIEMPGMSGLEMARRIREENRRIPIIFITAHTRQEYLLDAFEAKAYHYLVKPLILEKLGEILRECRETLTQKATLKQPICHRLGNGLWFDTLNGTLKKSGEEIILTKKEMLMLQLLLEHPAQVVPYRVIEQEVWEGLPMTKNALRTLINTLRRKIEPIELISRSGIGYQLMCEA